MYNVKVSGQICPRFFHADDWTGNQQTLQRQFVRGFYELQTHDVVSDYWESVLKRLKPLGIWIDQWDF